MSLETWCLRVALLCCLTIVASNDDELLHQVFSCLVMCINTCDDRCSGPVLCLDSSWSLCCTMQADYLLPSNLSKAMHEPGDHEPQQSSQRLRPILIARAHNNSERSGMKSISLSSKVEESEYRSKSRHRLLSSP